MTTFAYAHPHHPLRFQASLLKGYAVRITVPHFDIRGVWDENATKLGCDDHCKTINVMNKLIE